MFLRLILCKTRITHTGDLIQWATKTVAAAKAVAGHTNGLIQAKNRRTIETTKPRRLDWPAKAVNQDRKS